MKAANLTIDAFEIGNECDWICFNGKRQSISIYAQGSFGAEVESWWHREDSIASTGAERKRIS